MTIDEEFFIRDAIEKAIKEKPEYEMIRLEGFAISIDSGKVRILRGVDLSEY